MNREGEVQKNSASMRLRVKQIKLTPTLSMNREGEVQEPLCENPRNPREK